MGKIQASMGILGGTLNELGGGFASVGNVISGFAGAGVAGAAIAATGEIIQGLKWSVGQAAEAEQAIKNLSVAVEKSGTAWDTVSKATQETLSQMQQVTVYSDEQLAGALERLLTFGMSYDDAMKTLSTTVDLAAAKHMDLESASNLVGKAFMGNTAILARYGVDITTSKEATAAMKDATDTLAAAIKTSGADLQGFSDVLGQAGVTLQDSSGKMRSAKDSASELIGAFQSGAIDVEKFDQIMGELGISIDTSKLKAADFPAVMAALNEQFGGTAQEQAKTYAGIQERFKNALSDLGEKIGGILLPALSGITEAMIPVADWFGKGVDAVQAWLTEVGKMPEVQGIMAAVNEAFKGFWSYLDDLWKFIQDTFGPVLQDLWLAFKDLWDALSPIGEALSEIFSIFGEGTGGVDLLKGAIMAIAFEIKGFAEIVKAVAPYIREFADAFKAAADFVAPVLGQIKDAITGFLDALKSAFQGFYNWLVGRSLWMDMWNAILAITGQMITTLLGDLAGKMFEPVKAGFTTLMQTTQGTWNTGWLAVQTTFQTAAVTLQTGVTTAFTQIRDFIQTNMGEYAPIANLALTNMENLVNAGLAIMRGDWDSALGYIKNAISGATEFWQSTISTTMNALQNAVSAGVSAIQGAFSSLVGSAQAAVGQVQSLFGQAQSIIGNIGQGIVQATKPATDEFTILFNQAAAGVVSAGKQLYDWLVGGSIWPDMMDMMQTLTSDTMTNIQNTVTSGFNAVVSQAQASLAQLEAMRQRAVAVMAAQPGLTSAQYQAIYDAQEKAASAVAQAATVTTKAATATGGGVFGGFWEPETPLNLNPAQMADYGQKLANAIFEATIGRSPALGPATAEEVRAAQVNATLPISVVVDGVTVSRVVEQRLIEQRRTAGQGY